MLLLERRITFRRGAFLSFLESFFDVVSYFFSFFKCTNDSINKVYTKSIY